MLAVAIALVFAMGLFGGGYLGYRWGKVIDTRARAALNTLIP